MTNVKPTTNRFDASGLTKEIAAAMTKPAKPIALDNRPICVNGGSVGSEYTRNNGSRKAHVGRIISRCPRVTSSRHDGMPSQLKERTENPFNHVRRTETVSQKKARRRQTQVTYPPIDGKNPFSLINHASSR